MRRVLQRQIRFLEGQQFQLLQTGKIASARGAHSAKHAGGLGTGGSRPAANGAVQHLRPVIAIHGATLSIFPAEANANSGP